MGNDHAERSSDFFLTSEPEPMARPAGLGALGSDSYFFEPYTIRSPHRVFVGDDVLIGARAVLSVVEEFRGRKYDSRLTIGDGCEIGRDLFVSCTGSIEIGEQVAISARVFIGDSDRDYGDASAAIVDQGIEAAKPVRIGARAALGVGVVVLPGVTIGERAIVSAGAVVTRDVPARCVVFGNPARIVKSWDDEAGEWISGPPRKA